MASADETLNTEQEQTNVDEFDISDIEDIEPYDNSKESYNFNYVREDKNKNIPELHIDSVQQQSSIIGFDFIKLKFPLIHSRDAGFKVNRHVFFITYKPEIPAKIDESIAV